MSRHHWSFLAITILALFLSACDVSPPATTTGADIGFATTSIWTPNTPAVGQATSVSCVAVNNGGTAADASIWSLQRDNVATGVTGSIPALAPGATYNFSVNLPAESVIGVHTFTVTLNADGRIAETDTSNNAQTLSITFTGPDILSALAVSLLPTPDPTATPTTSTQWIFSMTVANASTTTSYTNVPWRMYRDSDAVVYTSGSFANLAHTSQITNFPITLGTQTAGPHTFTFVIDPDNTLVSDPVTGNNAASLSITVIQAASN